MTAQMIQLQHHHSFPRSKLHLNISSAVSFPLLTYSPSCVSLYQLAVFWWGWGEVHLDGSLLLAHVVGLQLLRLWQRSADRRPKTDSRDEQTPAAHDGHNEDHNDGHYITQYGCKTFSGCNKKEFPSPLAIFFKLTNSISQYLWETVKNVAHL